jgi:hypothetical protein
VFGPLLSPGSPAARSPLWPLLTPDRSPRPLLDGALPAERDAQPVRPDPAYYKQRELVLCSLYCFGPERDAGVLYVGVARTLFRIEPLVEDCRAMQALRALRGIREDMTEKCRRFRELNEQMELRRDTDKPIDQEDIDRFRKAQRRTGPPGEDASGAKGDDEP